MNVYDIKSIGRRNVPTGTHNSQTMRDSHRNYGTRCLLSSVRPNPDNYPETSRLDFFRTKVENVCGFVGITGPP